MAAKLSDPPEARAHRQTQPHAAAVALMQRLDRQAADKHTHQGPTDEKIVRSMRKLRV
jgi:hypothetical protein